MIRMALTISAFRSRLKTHLFYAAYEVWVLGLPLHHVTWFYWNLFYYLRMVPTAPSLAYPWRLWDDRLNRVLMRLASWLFLLWVPPSAIFLPSPDACMFSTIMLVNPGLAPCAATSCDVFNTAYQCISNAFVYLADYLFYHAPLWSTSGGLPKARRERYITWPLLLLLLLLLLLF